MHCAIDRQSIRVVATTEIDLAARILQLSSLLEKEKRNGPRTGVNVTKRVRSDGRPAQSMNSQLKGKVSGRLVN